MMQTKKASTLHQQLRSLFHGRSKKSTLFNRILIFLNLAVFGIFALEHFNPGNPSIIVLELTFGVIFLLEYVARLWIAPKKVAHVFNIYSIIDLLVLISLFAPTFIGNLALLRILRSLKILRTYYLVNLAEKESTTIARYRATIVSVLNFFAFLGIMTAIVFVAEAQFNPHINSYLDALYFTVSTLTTTGFGDITAAGPWGKLLSVVAMLVGITLFFQLTRTIFTGARVSYTCKDCGLTTHDFDATHCKHCGKPIKHRHGSHLPY